MSSPLRHSSNEITSGVLHLIGAVLALALLVLLIVFSSLRGTAWHIVGYTIYGVFMVLLYLGSTIYHLMPHRKEVAKDILQRIDHALVYIFIAATYTPVCFVVLGGKERWITFGVVWSIAAVGSWMKLARLKTHPFFPVILYVIMGWFIAIFMPTLLKVMTPTTFWLLVTGGVAYTVGVIFFALESKLPPRKYFWMHEIFHIFVLIGTTLHTIMMFYLLQKPHN